MSSLLPDHEYDIFISYRHNDNRSGWVKDFVDALEEELASTIKEPLTVYFDKNPHDGLLETHNVDKSLEGKLKCLIFIPIISQTYCDTKSFAWQHEFCAFNNLVKGDKFGRDIKLNNGNIASRILPVKIHDLDAEDKSQIENEIGGVLRAIEFIYKEPGVNRPLRQSDDRNSNLNKTDYRNQLNKVANAIKEIMHSLKSPVTHNAPASNHNPHHESRPKSKVLPTAAAVIIVLLSAGYFFYPRIMGASAAASAPDKSIAVLPFDNLSSDSLEYLSEGITDQLISSLANIEGLKVASRTSVMKYKGSSSPINEIADELKVSYILEGSVQRGTSQVRISARLIQANNNSQQWNETYNQEFEDILKIQDDISTQVAGSLGKLLDLTSIKSFKPANSEAYDRFLRGDFLWRRAESHSIRQAMGEFKAAVELDPQFELGYSRIAFGYLLIGSAWGDSKFSSVIDSARFFVDKALALNPKSSGALNAAGTIKWWFDKKYDEAEVILKKSVFEDRSAVVVANLGFFYNTQGNFNEALRYTKEGYKLDPAYLAGISFLGDSYLLLKQYDNAEATYMEAFNLYPEHPEVAFRLAWLYFQTKRYKEMETILSPKIQTIGPRNSRQKVYLAIAKLKLGKEKESEALIDEVATSSKTGIPVYDFNYYMAIYYSQLIDESKMYHYLESSIAENETELIWLKEDPFFEPFRNNPKFISLLKKAGFK